MTQMTPKEYKEWIRRAHDEKFALAAVNVSDSNTAIAAVKAFEELNSPGIIQITSGSAKHNSINEDLVEGSFNLAEFLQSLIMEAEVPLALHTDHCHAELLEEWLKPLVELQAEVVEANLEAANEEGLSELPEDFYKYSPAYTWNSNMFDGSHIDLDANIEKSVQMANLCAAAHSMLECELGTWGGSEDGVSDDSSYTSVEDVVKMDSALAEIGLKSEDYLLAVAFGNAHGMAKKANLKPEILRDINEATGKEFNFVFHGTSGSDPAVIRQAIEYGVVKVNLDSQFQFAYSGGMASVIADNVDLVRDSAKGKKFYDPRVGSKAARVAMTESVKEYIEILGSANKAD
ncbi:MAG: class II fructose-bisphosphate aldolase [Bifidobacteriaceae bacterium]|jgi:fructose-bisphosphate aldolase class II|nr:class II fructose-bisphosphate aldolase [Bifidobacteriaceae bacterium]